MDLELRHLRAVVAVADRGSFTEAARDLGITQPALSRTIAQAEKITAATLFDRTSRSARPSEAAYAFIESARRILDDVTEAVAGLSAGQTVRLGFSWLLPDPWAAAAITAFEAATGASVEVIRVDDPLAGMREGRIDVAVTRRRPSGHGVRARLMFRERRVAAVSTHSPLAVRTDLTWPELGEHPLVVNTLTGTTTAASWRDPVSRAVIKCANFDEWLELIAADRGVGAVPELAARRVTHSRVRFLPLTDAPSTSVYLARAASSHPLSDQLIACGLTAAHSDPDAPANRRR
ncbi:LysR family transcriptional regulator [Gordonia sp. NPDC003504]